MPHKWKPIEDLPEDWAALTDGELTPLLQFWKDQRADFEQNGSLRKFLGQLTREWAIETGQIEGVYDIDHGITRTLIERGIKAELIPHTAGQRPPELIAAIIQDHLQVLEGLFQFVNGTRPLSRGYVHELHAALLFHQDTATVVDQFGSVFETELLNGRYKQRPNNPTRPDGSQYEYCPPEHVEAEMDRLITMHTEHEARGVPVEIEAAWLHHRFAQIHPYQDGNGRVARALASLVFLKPGWFPVVVRRDDLAWYIGALEFADEGDLRPLITLFVDLQKRALIQATLAGDAQPVETVDEAIAVAKGILTAAGRSLDPAAWLKSKETADRLMDITADRLEKTASALADEIGASRPDFRFSSHLGGPSKANKIDYDRTAELSITNGSSALVRIAAHVISFRGLIVINAFFSPSPREIQLISNEPFHVNYAESCENAERRFRPWLERSLVRALTLWRQSL